MQFFGDIALFLALSHGATSKTNYSPWISVCLFFNSPVFLPSPCSPSAVETQWTFSALAATWSSRTVLTRDRPGRLRWKRTSVGGSRCVWSAQRVFQIHLRPCGSSTSTLASTLQAGPRRAAAPSGPPQVSDRHEVYIFRKRTYCITIVLCCQNKQNEYQKTWTCSRFSFTLYNL